MNAPVDVLSVVAYALDQDERGAFGITKQEAAERIREARAAVAELIEADKEYDEARQRALGIAEPEDHPALAAVSKAEARREAALARVGGAA